MLTNAALILSIITNGAMALVAFTNANNGAPLQDRTLIRVFGAIFTFAALLCLLALSL